VTLGALAASDCTTFVSPALKISSEETLLRTLPSFSAEVVVPGAGHDYLAELQRVGREHEVVRHAARREVNWALCDCSQASRDPS